MKNWLRISEDQYRKDFGIMDSKLISNNEPDPEQPFKPRSRLALEHALDIRKFEIELYWRRATYFWAFIAAAFAAYAAIQSADKMERETRSQLSFLIASVGLVFSWGWFCANRGSKQWQGNWENHVDLLEDGMTGPLYKTVLSRPKTTGYCNALKTFIWGPKAFSVSKINQVISLFVAVVWIPLVIKVSPSPRLSWTIAGIDWFRTLVLLFAIVALVLIGMSTTDQENNLLIAERRSSKIEDPPTSQSP